MKKLRIDEWIIQLLQAMYFTKCEIKCTLKVYVKLYVVLVRVIVQMLGCTSALSLVHSFSL